MILYPTLKNKVFNYKEGSNISPGSSLGSVIGYPSLTVPMGFVDEFSYGIEFLGEKNSEDTLYNVAISYEKVNGNVITTSKLTPSLYKVSDNVVELLKLYDEVLLTNSKMSKVNNWLKDVEDFIKNYNDFKDVDDQAKKLIKDYNLKLIKLVSSSNYESIAMFFKYAAIIMTIISFLIIFKEIKMCFK